MKQLIKKVRSYMKDDRTMVCINDTIHLSLKQIAALGYSNIQALIGNEITVVYYALDEEMVNKAKCTKADTIVKSFEIEASADDIKMQKAVNAGFKVFALS